MNGLTPRRETIWKCSFVIVLLSMLVLFKNNGHAGDDIPIKTSQLDLVNLHRIVGGGTTPEAVAYPGVWGLKTIATRRLRLINVDGNLNRILPDGSLDIRWSKHLRDGLQLCKDNGWIPRIIIGQTLPSALEMERVGGGKYGPSSWVIYDNYVATLLKYVIDEWGFMESEWEVGNEMNTPSENWVAKKKPEGPLDMEGFSAYMKLYAHIAKSVEKVRGEYPHVTIKVGGPAISPPGYLEEDETRNWVLRFVDKVAVERLPCDFVSVHIYGNGSTGAETFHALNRLRQHIALRQVSAQISVSEWGVSWRSDREVNFGPISGAFVFEFVRIIGHAKISDAIFLALSEFRDQKWPVLYDLNGAPTHAMKAMQLLSSLNGLVLQCETGLVQVSCLAVQSPSSSINVLVWYIDWWHDKIETVPWNRPVKNVSISVSGIRGSDYVRSVARIISHSSNENYPRAIGEVVATEAWPVRFGGLSLGYGDYVHLTVTGIER